MSLSIQSGCQPMSINTLQLEAAAVNYQQKQQQTRQPAETAAAAVATAVLQGGGLGKCRVFGILVGFVWAYGSLGPRMGFTKPTRSNPNEPRTPLAATQPKGRKNRSGPLVQQKHSRAKTSCTGPRQETMHVTATFYVGV